MLRKYQITTSNSFWVQLHYREDRFTHTVLWWETQQHQALHCYFRRAAMWKIKPNTKITLITETWRFVMATVILAVSCTWTVTSPMTTFWIMFLCSFFICKKKKGAVLPNMNVNLELFFPLILWTWTRLTATKEAKQPKAIMLPTTGTCWTVPSFTKKSRTGVSGSSNSVSLNQRASVQKSTSCFKHSRPTSVYFWLFPTLAAKNNPDKMTRNSALLGLVSLALRFAELCRLFPGFRSGAFAFLLLVYLWPCFSLHSTFQWCAWTQHSFFSHDLLCLTPPPAEGKTEFEVFIGIIYSHQNSKT